MKGLSKSETLNRKTQRALKRVGFPTSNPLNDYLPWMASLKGTDCEYYSDVMFAIRKEEDDLDHNSSLFWAEFYR